ncbi:MAG: phosphatidate cytidylyltransferase [Chloroflexi bacterium]|nr:phosphatidate cytidylyltransferase [Chloroflexota bacterium]
MLKTRLIVAAIALPVIFAVIIIGSWPYFVLVLTALLLAGVEYISLIRQQHTDRSTAWITLSLIVLGLVSAWADRLDWRHPGLAVVLVVGVLAAVRYYERDQTDTVTALALALFGGLYIGWLGSYLLLLRQLDDGLCFALFVYGCAILSDTTAYITGTRWGRHPIARHVSPQKSWEGYLGSIAGGGFLGVVVGLLAILDSLTIVHATALGLLIGALGTVGDLGISLIKRQAGTKDSSHLIPGHGGLLDRTDSVLIAAIIGYYYIIWLVQ